MLGAEFAKRNLKEAAHHPMAHFALAALILAAIVCVRIVSKPEEIPTLGHFDLPVNMGINVLLIFFWMPSMIIGVYFDKLKIFSTRNRKLFTDIFGYIVFFGLVTVTLSIMGRFFVFYLAWLFIVLVLLVIVLFAVFIFISGRSGSRHPASVR